MEEQTAPFIGAIAQHARPPSVNQNCIDKLAALEPTAVKNKSRAADHLIAMFGEQHRGHLGHLAPPQTPRSLSRKSGAVDERERRSAGSAGQNVRHRGTSNQRRAPCVFGRLAARKKCALQPGVARSTRTLSGRWDRPAPLRNASRRTRAAQTTEMNIREHNELCGGQTRLYIGNLPFSMMEAHLRRLLSQVGVTRVQIEMGPKRAAERRFAFANMSSRDEKRTIESFDGQIS